MNTVTVKRMSPWMKIFFNLFFFSSFTFAECVFREDIKKVASLSGVTTVLLFELGLLKSSSMIGISHYHPIEQKSFNGKRYPGGIFMAPATLTEFSNALVFYDESRELKKILETKSDVQAIEVKTRNLLPLEAMEHAVVLVLPYIQGCEGKISKLRTEAQDLQSDLVKKVPAGTKVYFYLGKIKPPRFPEMLIVQDGVVKLLQKEKKIITYPSPLSYVNWSSKILQKSSKETLHVGIIDSGDLGTLDLSKEKEIHNVTYPGALVPGLSQLRAFHFWAKSL